MKTVEISEILNPGDERENRRREKRVREGFWRAARKAAGKIPFMEDLVAGYYCALDERTPRRVRATLFASLAYFIMPIDVIPDFIAVFGFTDDFAVLMAALTAVRGHITPAHRLAAQEAIRGLD